MVRTWNPESAPPPAANYSQCSVAQGPGLLVTVAGQIGVRPDGALADGIDAQCRQALENVLAIVSANGLDRRDLVKVSVFLLDRAHLCAYRQARDDVLGADCRPPSTLLIVTGLASPKWLVEVEAQAFRTAGN